MAGSHLGEQLIFQGKSLSVSEDRYEQNGDELTWETVHRQPAVAIVATTADDELILVKHYTPPLRAEMLAIPAGLIDQGESAFDAARRELLEETGFLSDELQVVGDSHPAAGYSDETVTIVYAGECRKKEEDTPDEEPADPVVVPMAKLSDFLPGGTSPLTDGNSLIGLGWLQRQRVDG